MAYTTSQTVKDLFASETPQIFRGTFTFADSTTLVVDQSKVIMGSMVLDRSCVSDNSLELGSCTASEFSMTLLNADGSLDGKNFEGAELYAEIGVSDGTNTYYIPLGRFIVDGVPKVRDTVSINALDRMCKFDKTADATLTATWWGSGKTIQQIINRCCSVCGVTLATNIASFPNANVTLGAVDTVFTSGVTDITYRQLLSYCVGAMGKCAWMNAEGNLEIGFAEPLDISTSAIAGIAIAGLAIVGNSSGTGVIQQILDESNRYSSDYEDYVIVTTGAFCDKTETDASDEQFTHHYIIGSDDYAFDLTDNPIVAWNPQTLLANLTGVIGITYHPMSAVTVPYPWLFPLDWVAYKKGDTNLYSIVTSFTFTMNGNNGIKSVGESPQEKSRASVGSVASRIKQVIDYAKELAEETLATAGDNATALITSATGGQVYFKKVNGVIEEIDIMDDTCYADFTSATPTYTVGKCWRWNKNGFGFSSTGYNGTYTLAMTMDGNIVADFLKVGTISSGSGTSQNYWDLENNVLCLNITEGSIHLTTSSGTADHITLRHNDTYTTVSSDYFNAHSEDSEYITSYGAYAVSSRIGGFTTTGGLSKFGLVTTSYIYDSQKPGSVPYRRTIIDPEGITIEALDTSTGVQQTYSSLSLTGLVINGEEKSPPHIESGSISGSPNTDNVTSYWVMKSYSYEGTPMVEIWAVMYVSLQFANSYGALYYSDPNIALPTKFFGSSYVGNPHFMAEFQSSQGIYSTNVHTWNTSTGAVAVYVGTPVKPSSGSWSGTLTIHGARF